MQGQGKIADWRTRSALLVVDMQVGFDHPAWGVRNNPMAECRVAALIEAWRRRGAGVIHVHHNSPAADGHFRPGSAGVAVKPQAAPRDGEPVYRKTVNSAFIGTTLEADLRAKGVRRLVVCGLTTNHCISTTARMAGNLGFETWVVSDATAAFDRLGLDGRMRTAEEVHQAALSDLRDEFARIVDSERLLELTGAAHA